METTTSAPALFDYNPPLRRKGAMSTNIEKTINARIEAGLLDPDLWAAEIAVAMDAALDIDNPDPRTKAYARAATRSGLLEALDRIPRPEAVAASMSDLDRVLTVITGGASDETAA